MVVLYGYQGADTDAEQLALTEQLLMLPLVSFVLLFGCSLACWLGISTRSPPKSLAWQKGFRLGSGLTLRRLGPWLLVHDQLPTCKRGWGAASGHRRVFVVGCPLAAAAVLSCKVQADRWLLLILRFGLFLTDAGGLVRLLSLCNALTFGLLLGCLQKIRVGVPSRLRFKGFGGL